MSLLSKLIKKIKSKIKKKLYKAIFSLLKEIGLKKIAHRFERRKNRASNLAFAKQAKNRKKNIQAQKVAYHVDQSDLYAQLKHNLAKYEGIVDHCYLDTRGNVTVGVGHLISKPEQALSLDFVYKHSGKKASDSDIKKEFNHIAKQPYGQKYAAGWYQHQSKLILSPASIDAITENHIQQFEKELCVLYGRDFVNYPHAVKLALFDMIFNLGMTKLNRFVKFNKLIKSGQFNKAANECRRRGIANSRNDYVKSLLRSA